MDSENQPLCLPEPCQSLHIDVPECFICRDVQVKAADPLQSFCDCKNLLAHHSCLCTWIQTSSGSEDRLRCGVCRAKYNLRRTSRWCWLLLQWQTWVIVSSALVSLGLVPGFVYWLMAVVEGPPPPVTFKVAVVIFGMLSEALLVRYLYGFLNSKYQEAKRRAFVVLSRDARVDSESTGQWGGPRDSTRASLSQVDGSKVDTKSGLRFV